MSKKCTLPELDERLREIADNYGYGRQKDQLIEEMAELTGAICHLNRYGELDNSHHDLRSKVYEEIGDVEIMLEQIKYLLNCSGEVRAFREYKIKRQLERMEE